KGLALYILHYYEAVIAIFSDLIGGADIWMFQLGRCSGFANEASLGHFIRLQRGWQKLYRDPPVELCVFGKINLAHPTGSKQTFDSVRTDGQAHQRLVVLEQSGSRLKCGNFKKVLCLLVK